MRHTFTLSFLFLLIGYKSYSQVGGNNAFQFLHLPGNAQVAAIGGKNVSLYNNDVMMTWQNPALLRDTLRDLLEVSYIPFYASVKGGALSYVHKYKKIGTIAAGIQYINYGKITERDEYGNDLGEFKPQDVVVSIAKSHTLAPFTMGVTLKYVSSVITKTYAAYAIMMDLGGVYKHPTREFTVGLVIKNAGFSLVNYTKDTPAKAPFDIQAGTSYKLEHVPLRFSLTAHHLYRFDITYLDTAQNKKYDIDGTEIVQTKKVGDQVLRHFIIGTELLLSKSIHARFGYNFQRRREMRLEERAGGAGFSWGIMIRLKSFYFDYSRASYHLAGGRNWVTLTMDTHKLFGKNKGN